MLNKYTIAVAFAVVISIFSINASFCTRGSSGNDKIRSVETLVRINNEHRLEIIPDPWPNGDSPKLKINKSIEQASDASGGKYLKRVEETGPDLESASAASLITLLNDADKWMRARAAWQLGNRSLFKGWIPDVDQQRSINAYVDSLLARENMLREDGYGDARSQLHRLWSLGHESLIKAIDPANCDRTLDLAIKTVAATRNRAVIVELVRQFQVEPDPARKKWLAFTLSCMKEQRRISIPK